MIESETNVCSVMVLERVVKYYLQPGGSLDGKDENNEGQHIYWKLILMKKLF